MKIKHRIPPEAYFVSEPITLEYQAEVDRSMARGAQREREAVRRLDVAIAKMAKAAKIKAKPQRSHAMLVARELVELRRQELLQLQRQMNASPSSAQHRSRTDRHKPVIPMTTI